MQRNFRVRAVLILTAALSALTVDAIGQDHTQKPVEPCSDLASMHVENTLIFSAKEVPDGAPIGQFGPMPPIGPQPAHCVVEGEVNKHTGLDGNEYGDKFQLRLPNAWTGRFLFQGGGGLDGMISPAVGPARSGFKTALARGYAVVATDGGHQGKNPGDAEFGADRRSQSPTATRTIR